VEPTLNSSLYTSNTYFALCLVHYNAYLEYNDEPYDSSRLRNQPEQLKLGQGGLLGFEIAVSSMKRSEISRFLIKPDYAFGRIGCPPRIPPNATLLFEIELISFIDSKAADDFDSFSEEDRRQTSVEQLIEVCHSEREIGNDFFQRQQYGRAMTKYSRVSVHSDWCCIISFLPVTGWRHQPIISV
jgi:FK506-binding protein 6